MKKALGPKLAKAYIPNPKVAKYAFVLKTASSRDVRFPVR